MKLHELLGEYRESLGTAQPPDFDELLRRSRRKRGQVWMATVAAIAACLAVVVFWPREQAAKGIATVPSGVAVVHNAPSQPLAAPVQPARPVVAARRVVRDEMAGFVAIAETSMLPQPQMLQVLRVNVSGTRLAALGVLRPDQMIRPTMMADVLLGDDGMARAIRVVANE